MIADARTRNLLRKVDGVIQVVFGVEAVANPHESQRPLAWEPQRHCRGREEQIVPFAQVHEAGTEHNERIFFA